MTYHSLLLKPLEPRPDPVAHKGIIDDRDADQRRRRDQSQAHQLVVDLELRNRLLQSPAERHDMFVKHCSKQALPRAQIRLLALCGYISLPFWQNKKSRLQKSDQDTSQKTSGLFAMGSSALRQAQSHPRKNPRPQMACAAAGNLWDILFEFGRSLK